MLKNRYLFLLPIIALILVLPNLVLHKMILGADALFHYNRFYETAMQIKHWNFSYFISIYGFQQSGRIVNALYGPVFSYFQGLLVLLSGTWFRYQIVSNFVLLLTSGYSMYGLLRYSKINQLISFCIALIFMTTYSIQYWVINQGFTSWGTCLLPLALIPIVELYTKKHFPIVKIAVSMALITQIHLLSALMLASIYAVLVMIYLVKERSLNIVIPLIKSIFLYLLLILNILVSSYSVYSANSLKMPFVNHDMGAATINQNGAYWLIFPKIFVLIILWVLVLFFHNHQKNTSLSKISLAVSLLFLILTTSIVPWTLFLQNKFPLVTLIQFPFRFFVPFTILFLLFAAGTIDTGRKRAKTIPILAIFTFLSILTCFADTSQNLLQWNEDDFKGKYIVVNATANDIQHDFFEPNLEGSLADYSKATPDYLPLYQNDSSNKYSMYKKEIIERNYAFKKVVRNGHLVIEWNAAKEGNVTLPIVLYKHSQLEYNNIKITPVKLTKIGSPVIQQHAGKNTVILTYKQPSYVFPLIFFSLICWLFILIRECRKIYIKE